MNIHASATTRTRSVLRWAPLPLTAVLAILGAGVAAVGQATPTCDGQPATIVGTPRSDDLTATEGQDVIVGLGGNDSIYGRDGADRICGGDGQD